MREKSRPEYDPNALADFETFNKVKRNATHTATNVIAMSPDGVVIGLKASGLTIKNHPFMGGLITLGIASAFFVVPWFFGSLFVAAFAPARLSETASIPEKAGNATGRLINGVATVGWSAAKPAVGTVLTNYYAGQQNQNQPANNFTPSQTTPGVVQISTFGSPSQTPQQGELTEEQQRAIENFMK